MDTASLRLGEIVLLELNPGDYDTPGDHLFVYIDRVVQTIASEGKVNFSFVLLPLFSDITSRIYFVPSQDIELKVQAVNWHRYSLPTSFFIGEDCENLAQLFLHVTGTDVGVVTWIFEQQKTEDVHQLNSLLDLFLDVKQKRLAEFPVNVIVSLNKAIAYLMSVLYTF